MADEFSKEIIKHAVARAALALDYKQVHESVLDTLSDIVVHYIETLGEKIHDHAELAGRAIPGIHDCISSLETVRVTTKTSYQELNAFAFGAKGDSKGPTWNQPFPVEIPPFPSVPQSKTLSTTSVSDRKLVDKAFSHLPAFPPSRTYDQLSANDSKDSSELSSKKRKLENETEDSKSQLREKKIIATKNIQKTLTRLDTMLKSDGSRQPSSGDVLRSTSPHPTNQGPLYCGPSLSSVNQVGSSSHSNGGFINSNHQIVLDENCDFFKGLSKEEKLLMGLSVGGQPQPQQASGETQYHHAEIDDER